MAVERKSGQNQSDSRKTQRDRAIERARTVLGRRQDRLSMRPYPHWGKEEIDLARRMLGYTTVERPAEYSESEMELGDEEYSELKSTLDDLNALLLRQYEDLDNRLTSTSEAISRMEESQEEGENVASESDRSEFWGFVQKVLALIGMLTPVVSVLLWYVGASLDSIRVAIKEDQIELRGYLKESLSEQQLAIDRQLVVLERISDKIVLMEERHDDLKEKVEDSKTDP